MDSNNPMKSWFPFILRDDSHMYSNNPMKFEILVSLLYFVTTVTTTLYRDSHVCAHVLLVRGLPQSNLLTTQRYPFLEEINPLADLYAHYYKIKRRKHALSLRKLVLFEGAVYTIS